MNNYLRKIQSYGIEGFVILFSVILSFYIEGQRDLSEKNKNKDKLIIDLISSINEDLEQINNIHNVVSDGVQKINDIQSDINSSVISEQKSDFISKAITANVGQSFFPQRGIFNQLIDEEKLISNIKSENIYGNNGEIDNLCNNLNNRDFIIRYIMY